MAIIQLRVDDKLKQEASEIYDEIGLDLSSAIRMFLKRSIQIRGIPFPTSLQDEINREQSWKTAIERAQKVSIDNGNSKMSIKNIDEEIVAARKERKLKRK